MSKPALTTHVLDLTTGTPAQGIAVSLSNAGSEVLATGVTDQDGRIVVWNQEFALIKGSDYVVEFDTGTWFAARNEKTLYPTVSICFSVEDSRHYHIPLLVSAYGYSTYRGS